MMKKAAPVPAFIEHDSVAYIPQNSALGAPIDNQMPVPESGVFLPDHSKADEAQDKIETTEIQQSSNTKEEITLSNNLDRVEKELNQLMADETEQDVVVESEPVNKEQTQDVEKALQSSPADVLSSNDADHEEADK